MLDTIVIVAVATVIVVVLADMYRDSRKRRHQGAIFLKTLGDLGYLSRGSLHDLRTALESFRGQEGIDTIVPFFNLVSPWHDDNPLVSIANQLEKFGGEDIVGVVEDLQELSIHFCQAGQNESGWNRTKPRQVVTEDDVYLGNVYGLWTKTVAFWKTCKDNPKGGWGFGRMEDLNSYDVISNQAGDFMASHIGPMVEIIERLESAVQGAPA